MSAVEERLRALLQEAAPEMTAIPMRDIEHGARRRRRRSVTLAAVGPAGAVIVVAAGGFGFLTISSAPTQPPVSRPTSTDSRQPDGEYTRTDAWLAVGEQIRQARRDHPGLRHVIPVQLSAPV